MLTSDHNGEPAGAGMSTPANSEALAAQVAHELANLLDGSLRNVGLVLSALLDETLDDAASAKALAPRLHTAQQAMRQMVPLVQQLMHHRAPAAALPATMDLRQTIDHAVSLLTPLAQSRHVQLHAEIDHSTSGLLGAAIGPVITNAVGNSIEAISAAGVGRSVRIAARCVEQWLVLSVRDDGPGLDAAVLDDGRQFRFGITTKPTGHGLGLGHCRDIAGQLGGELSIRNASGGGVELILRLPAASLRDPTEPPVAKS